MKSTACRSIVAQWSPDSLYRSPNPKKSANNGRNIIIWHLRQKNIDRQEKQPNSGTTSADCPSTVALFWRHRHRPLVDLGNMTVFCEGTLFYQLYWRGQYWVFIVLKMQNESTRFFIRGFILFMHYAWLHWTSINPVSPVLGNVWLSYRRIHWSFLVPWRFFSRSFDIFLAPSRTFLVRTRNILVCSRIILDPSSKNLVPSRKNLSFEKYIFSFGREIFSFLREKNRVPSRKKLVLSRNILVCSRNILVRTKNILVCSRKILVPTRNILVCSGSIWPL